MDGTVLALVLLAIGLLVAWIVAWPLCWVWDRGLGRMRAARALPLARWSPLLLAAPLLAGVVVALGSVGALQLDLVCHCAATFALHLCSLHPENAAPLLPYAGLVLLLAAPRVFRAARSGWRGRAAVRVVHRRSHQAARDGEVRLLPLGTANAFTVGALRPVVLADRGWWASLTGVEQAIVRAHEEAHVLRRDPFTLGLTRALAALLPRGADGVLRWWQAGAEHAADRHAARTAADRLTVAWFLLRQARTRCAPVAPAFHGTATERRIEALADTVPLPSTTAGDLDRTFAGAVLLLGVGLLFGAELHHWADRLFTLLT